ncbi:hypothetical protein L1049_026710 [Liquidambar formosana]|uniref:J domain-containing protein required for chloroplast accumulation response 1 n=1 Tax=Liquidambar formosana TaxID=63359 RepID=A0AAP0NFA2_LIQFO
MDRFSQREHILLGNSYQGSPKTPLRNSDVDFHDVFGGPPRRSSIYETRWGVGEASDKGALLLREEEGSASRRRAWSGLGERPVFGEEVSNRRRYPSDDFFDDIFRGDESLSLTPRKADHRDPFASAPGSRVLSPARPLPPRAEPFGSSSPPAQLSLPAKLTKGMDFSGFASGNRSPSRSKDGPSNGPGSPHSPSTSTSRFSSQAIQGQDEWKNDVRPSCHQSPLSYEFSLSSQGSAKETKSDKTDTGANLKKDSISSTVSTSCNSSQFHFSIYKWASKGVPLMMPLRRGNSSRLKGKNIVRCSSSNGRVGDDSMVSELPTATLSVIEFPSLNVSANTMSSEVECKKQVNESLLNTSTQDKLKPCQSVEEAVLFIPESEPLDSLQGTVEYIPSNTISCETREETKPHSLPDGKTVEEISMLTKESCKNELKPLRSLFYDNKDGQGKDEMTTEAGGKESMVKTTKNSSVNVDVGKSIKKQDGKRTISNGAKVDKANLPGSPINTRCNLEKSKVKGKVKEFVKIFNQEAPSKPTINNVTQSRSSKWKGTSIFGEENAASVSTNRTDETMQMPNMDKKKTLTNASTKVDEYFKQSEELHSGIDTTIHIFSDTSSGQKDSSSSSSVSMSDGTKATLENMDDPFHGNFLIKELSQEQNKLPQTVEDTNDFQASDAKIRQWSKGKEGNIRSLLSTLQYVLWPESGWKPVPLVDIIEGNAVKRSYQKALLCLHPDKLQQKGAAAHQKYIAEKVFDILQEAWAHFNSLGSL